jgi:hypothetical protein
MRRRAAQPAYAEPLARLAALPGLDAQQFVAQLHDPSGDTSSLSFVSGLLLGSAIGVLVALLLAPRAGRRTRQLAWETGIQLRGRGLAGGLSATAG